MGTREVSPLVSGQSSIRKASTAFFHEGCIFSPETRLAKWRFLSSSLVLSSPLIAVGRNGPSRQCASGRPFLGTSCSSPPTNRTRIRAFSCWTAAHVTPPDGEILFLDLLHPTPPDHLRTVDGRVGKSRY